MFHPHPRVKVSIVGSLRDREVACSASDQGSNFESCVWRTVSSQSFYHPQDVLPAQFSLYRHKGGLKPDSFHFYCTNYNFSNRFPQQAVNPSCELNPIGVSCHKQAVKILGVFISNDMDLAIDLNLKEGINTIRSGINNRKKRNLTLIGKIVVLKTFIISRFQYVLSAIHIPEKYIKENNDFMSSFLWNGNKAQIKKSILCQPRSNRGLSAHDLKLIIFASRLRWLKLYCNLEHSLWKKLFKLNWSDLGVDFDVLLHCNLAEANVDIIKLQLFYQDLVKARISVNGADKKPLNEQCIWCNKNITTSTINVMSPGLFKSGLRFCSDLFMKNGDLIPFTIWQERGTQPREYIIWYALVNKISVLKKRWNGTANRLWMKMYYINVWFRVCIILEK